MTYTYAYKTSDGKRHEDAMDSPSREAVFESLRARGIRPIKVVAADGSKANGEKEEGKRKKEEVWRGIRLVLLVPPVLLVLAAGAWWAVRGGGRGAPAMPDAAVRSFLASQTRRYPIGDSAVVEKGILTGWSDVFPEEGERFFASFAVPGVKAGQRNTTVEELSAALKREVASSPGDGMEARQIKAMVEGMKAEARAYVAAGGNLVEYGRRLTERQDAEIAIYERAKADLEEARKTKSEDELLAYWETINDKLRNLGIRLLPLE